MSDNQKSEASSAKSTTLFCLKKKFCFFQQPFWWQLYQNSDFGVGFLGKQWLWNESVIVFFLIKCFCSGAITSDWTWCDFFTLYRKFFGFYSLKWKINFEKMWKDCQRNELQFQTQLKKKLKKKTKIGESEVKKWKKVFCLYICGGLRIFTDLKSQNRS